MAIKKTKLDSDLSSDGSSIDLFDDLDIFKRDLKKEFGDSTALTDEDFITSFIPTGLDSLDYLLGGGLAAGKLNEVCGLEGAGKSSFGIHMLGQIQKQGGLGILIDSEFGAGDRFRFDNFGVDSKKCIYTVEDLAEKAFSQVEKIANYIAKKNVKVPSLAIIDSIAALTTRAEQEADLDSAQYAVTARMIKRGVQRIKLILRETNLGLLCINQVRVKIGGMTNAYTGPEYVSPGGATLSFQYITRLFLTKGAVIGADKKQPEGHTLKVKVIKCKTSAALGRTLPVRFYYDRRGFDNVGTTYDLLNDSGYFPGSGAWKSISLPDGTEKKFNSFSTFDALYNESEENRQHFLKMMRNCYSSKLNLVSAPEELPIIGDAE